MQRVRWIGFVAVALLLLSTFASCIDDHYDCPPSTTNRVVRFWVDWSEFVEDAPSGMTVMVFPTDGHTPQSAITNDISHADFTLSTGRYRALAFNQSTDEYGTVTFQDMDAYETAKVMTTEGTSAWYSRAGTERIATQPEWIALSSMDSVEVTADRDTTNVYTATHNIICTVKVSVHVPGIKNMKSIRGALTGIAGGFLLGKQRPTQDTVTYVMNKWTKTLDADDSSKGTLTASFTCFGLPDGHQDQPTENRLDISILLADGQTQQDYSWDVGDKFEKGDDSSPPGGTTLAPSISASLQVSLNIKVDIDTPLPDVKPTDQGAFDVDIDQWGTPEEIPIEM